MISSSYINFLYIRKTIIHRYLETTEITFHDENCEQRSFLCPINYEMYT